METLNFASINPVNKNEGLPSISRPYTPETEMKVCMYFKKFIVKAAKETPPKIYKPILYIFIDGNLKYLKPIIP